MVHGRRMHVLPASRGSVLQTSSLFFAPVRHQGACVPYSHACTCTYIHIKRLRGVTSLTCTAAEFNFATTVYNSNQLSTFTAAPSGWLLPVPLRNGLTLPMEPLWTFGASNHPATWWLVTVAKQFHLLGCHHSFSKGHTLLLGQKQCHFIHFKAFNEMGTHTILVEKLCAWVFTFTKSCSQGNGVESTVRGSTLMLYI